MTELTIAENTDNKEKQKVWTVYKTTNLVNNKIYIGVHKTDNPMDEYLGSGTLLRYAVNKYGYENFQKEIIAIFDDKNGAYNLEAELVDRNFLNRKDTYNLVLGGLGREGHGCNAGKKMSGEQRRILSERRKGFKFTEASKLKMSLSHKGQRTCLGKKHTEESRRHMSEAHKGYVWIYNKETKEQTTVDPKSEKYKELIESGWEHGRPNGYRRKVGEYVPTEETKEKIRIANIGKKLSDETKKKLSEKLKGEGNPCFGKVYLKNEVLKCNKMVYPDSDEYFELLAQGYVRGRYGYVRKKSIASESRKGKIWIKNDILKCSKQVLPNSDEFYELERQGWVKGRYYGLRNGPKKITDELSKTERGEGGFGSTGK